MQTNLVQLAQRQLQGFQSGEEKDQQDLRAALISKQTKVSSEWIDASQQGTEYIINMKAHPVNLNIV